MRKRIISIVLCNCLIIGGLLGCGAKEGYTSDLATALGHLGELVCERGGNGQYRTYPCRSLDTGQDYSVWRQMCLDRKG